MIQELESNTLQGNYFLPHRHAGGNKRCKFDITVISPGVCANSGDFYILLILVLMYVNAFDRHDLNTIGFTSLFLT